MDVFEAIRTTRAMRRLDPSRDVSDADLLTIVEAATKSATGGNRQHVRWLVVRDPEKRKGLGELYRECAQEALRIYDDEARTNPATARNLKSYWHLADHMGEAPAIILGCAPGRAEVRLAQSRSWETGTGAIAERRLDITVVDRAP